MTPDIEEAIYDETPVRLNHADPLSWDQDAACRRYVDDDSYSWCPERAQSRPEERIICWTKCPVRRECLTWAVIQGEKHCIWGGYNYGQRRRIKAMWDDQDVTPDEKMYPRISVDPDEIFRIISEASISRYGDTPNTMLDFDDYEPSADELARLEQEETEGDTATL